MTYWLLLIVPLICGIYSVSDCLYWMAFILLRRKSHPTTHTHTRTAWFPCIHASVIGKEQHVCMWAYRPSSCTSKLSHEQCPWDVREIVTCQCFSLSRMCTCFPRLTEPLFRLEFSSSNSKLNRPTVMITCRKQSACELLNVQSVPLT